MIKEYKLGSAQEQCLRDQAITALEPGPVLHDFQMLVDDFGDNWEFTVKLDRIEPPSARVKAPRIRESHGKAPRQYPPWED